MYLLIRRKKILKNFLNVKNQTSSFLDYRTNPRKITVACKAKATTETSMIIKTLEMNGNNDIPVASRRCFKLPFGGFQGFLDSFIDFCPLT